MRRKLEREVRLQAPAGFVLPPLPGTPIGHLPQAEGGQAAFALGRLAELQAAKKRQAQTSFGPAWKGVNRSGEKAWL